MKEGPTYQIKDAYTIYIDLYELFFFRQDP